MLEVLSLYPILFPFRILRGCVQSLHSCYIILQRLLNAVSKILFCESGSRLRQRQLSWPLQKLFDRLFPYAWLRAGLYAVGEAEWDPCKPAFVE